MIPLRDSTRSRSFPYVTVAIIIINLYVYFLQFTSNQSGLEQIILNYALIPARFTEQLLTFSLSGLLHLPLVTSVFLHGGWFHVLFNMLYLWIFGDNIEDRLGHIRFFFFYILAGIAGNLAHVLLHLNSPTPLVGASGAIAGVLGAYIITFPRARITSLFFIVFFIFIREIPAIYFLLFWFIIQLVNGLTSLGIMGNTVAWWAHIGGFLAGILLMMLLKKDNRWSYNNLP
jgi:membrane associated rhomboid family serine protease